MPNASISAAGGAMSAVTAFYEITPETRRRIEGAVESLLALLDELDGDADLEDGHDAESDPAEMGLADSGALDLFMQEHCHFGLDFDWSGHEIARGLLTQVRR